MRQKNDAKSLGQHGERLAEKYLVSKGYSILARRYRTRSGEVDIICRPPTTENRNDTVVFVEVKTRRGLSFGRPYDSVTDTKLSRIGDVAAQFVYSQGLNEPLIRIDVIAIVYNRGDYTIEHLVDVQGSF